MMDPKLQPHTGPHVAPRSRTHIPAHPVSCPLHWEALTPTVRAGHYCLVFLLHLEIRNCHNWDLAKKRQRVIFSRSLMGISNGGKSLNWAFQIRIYSLEHWACLARGWINETLNFQRYEIAPNKVGEICLSLGLGKWAISSFARESTYVCYKAWTSRCARKQSPDLLFSPSPLPYRWNIRKRTGYKSYRQFWNQTQGPPLACYIFLGNPLNLSGPSLLYL